MALPGFRIFHSDLGGKKCFDFVVVQWNPSSFLSGPRWTLRAVGTSWKRARGLGDGALGERPHVCVCVRVWGGAHT